MGCDIHFHTEVRVNNKWEHYSNPRFPRSYDMFSLLAGVRWSGELKFKPFKTKYDIEKLPEDLNIITTKLLNTEVNGLHSFCWYDSQDIHDFYKHLTKNQLLTDLEHDYVGYLDGNGWDIISYRKDTPDWIQDVRWIFGFDN